ncbi:MAG: TrmB family transcriptional regulator [Candidatus Aenigmatarchaeota archaeon]
MADIKDVLKRVGLSSTEIKVYMALLRLREARAGRISKQCTLNRTTTYDALKRLLEKGLVTYVVKANVKWYQSTPPERLLYFLKNMQDEARDIMPELKRIYKEPKEKHNVTLFYGYKGIQTLFRDMIKEKKENRVLDVEGMLNIRMPYFVPQLIRMLEKYRIPVKHIVRRGVKIQLSKTTELRYFDEKFESQSTTNIYGDKIAIIVWSDPPEAVLIKNKSAAEAYKHYFDMLWKIAKK